MTKFFILMFLIVSCSKTSSTNPPVDKENFQNVIELDSITLEVSESSSLLIPDSDIDLGEVFVDILAKKKIIVKNKNRSAVLISKDFSSLSKITVEDNCPSTLDARSSCSIILSYNGLESDIAEGIIQENIQVNGSELQISSSTKAYPLNNSKIDISETQIDFGFHPSAIIKKHIFIRNKDSRNENLNISLAGVGNFVISKNTCQLVLISRKTCMIELQYTNLLNLSSQNGIIQIEGVAVNISVNTSSQINFADASSALLLSEDNKTVSRQLGGTNYDTAILSGLPAGSGKKYYVEFECNPCNGFIYLGANISATPPFLEPAISDFPLMDITKVNNIDETGVILGITSSAQSCSLNGGGGYSVPNVGHGNSAIVIGIAYDGNLNKIWYSRNGVWYNSDDPVIGLGGQSFVSIPGANIYFGVASYAGNSTAVFTKLDTSIYQLQPIGFELK